MSECSKCGKQSMSFTCRYCGEKYCSEHRLPENHNCNGLESGKKEEFKEDNSQKWFNDKFKDKKEPEKEFKKPSLFNEMKRIITNNITLVIIGITVFSFFLQNFGNYYDILVLRPSIEKVLSSPWTLLSVMLLHGNTFHLAANMITFYFFGSAVEKLIGGKKLLKIYLISGLVSSLAVVSFQNLLSLVYGSEVIGTIVGASGAVVAMLGIVAKLYPESEVLLYFVIPMKIRTAVNLFAGMETINLLAKMANIYLPVIGIFASSAHLAGLAVGLYYGKKLKSKYARNTSVFNPMSY